jgi:hypothetical protein
MRFLSGELSLSLGVNFEQWPKVSKRSQKQLYSCLTIHSVAKNLADVKWLTKRIFSVKYPLNFLPEQISKIM